MDKVPVRSREEGRTRRKSLGVIAREKARNTKRRATKLTSIARTDEAFQKRGHRSCRPNQDYTRQIYTDDFRNNHDKFATDRETEVSHELDRSGRSKKS